MKTNIKMRVNSEQSKRVQEICFENGVYWYTFHSKDKITLFSNYLYIDDKYITHDTLNNSTYFKDAIEQEIDEDLFIQTNGSCEENDLVEIGAIDYYSENIKLKKKIENLHIALNKKVEKNKNQALEISLLLKQKDELNTKLNQALLENENNITNLKDYIECKKIIKKYNFIDERNEFISKVLQSKYDVIDSFNDILKESSCKIENQWNGIVKLRASNQNNVINLNKEIDRLNFIIKYLEDRLNEK